MGRLGLGALGYLPTADHFRVVLVAKMIFDCLDLGSPPSIILRVLSILHHVASLSSGHLLRATSSQLWRAPLEVQSLTAAPHLAALQLRPTAESKSGGGAARLLES